MYCEVYLDSLFILQFVMNLFMLALVNCQLNEKVNKKRMLIGSLGGAASSVFSMFLPFSMQVRMIGSFGLSIICMLMITFRISGLPSLINIMKKVGISTLLLGGLSSIILRTLPKGEDTVWGLTIILSVVGIAFCMLKKVLPCHSIREKSCKVILYGRNKMEIDALIDTGNGLKEPISGKPVSILDKNVFEQLYDKETQRYRVIPYYSIGRKNGIMEGYLIERIIVETEEGRKEYKEVCVGICEEVLERNDMYKMILNPGLLE